MTHQEAAEYFEWNGFDAAKEYEARKLAANTLRALASAQSDAEKGFDDYNLLPNNDVRALMEYLPKNTAAPWNLLSSIVRTFYLAGHAQGYTAGLAAQEAKARQAEDDYAELEGDLRLTVENLERATDALAAARAECERLKSHHDARAKMICDISDACGDHILGKSIVDVIKEGITAKADALEFTNEVRRMESVTRDAVRVTGSDYVHNRISKDRPADVTAALERYK